MAETQAELTIEITRTDGAIHVGAHGSRGERPSPHVLDPSGASLASERLNAFTAGVAGAVARGQPIDDGLRDEACALHDALLRGAVRDVANRLLEASSRRPLLVRLMIRDAGLQAVPWEALCEPGSHAAFLGASDRMLLARGVASSEPGETCRVSGALRVMAIAPLPEARAALGVLESALAEPIEAGAVTWVPPILGDAASQRYLFEKLRRASPHVVHFIGHGAVDVQQRPLLRLADEEDGRQAWILAESLAHEITASFGGDLRLVVLEACEGAHPGAFGSAAEVLARKGAQAVVAHLWPVRSNVARDCSSGFYRAFTGAQRTRGDVVASLAAARRTLLLMSAEGFSPVVYLRSARSALFELPDRPQTPETRRFVHLRAIDNSCAYHAELGAETLSVGRQRRKAGGRTGEGNDFAVRVQGDDARSLRISRRHFEIRRSGHSYVIVDRSRGNTTLNGDPLPADEPVPLRSGDQIGLGGVLVLEFTVQDAWRNVIVQGPVSVGPGSGRAEGVVMEASVGDRGTVRDD